MKHKLFYIAFLLTLLSCSSHPGEIVIRGRFAHLEQGEFFIYSSDGGIDRMDTLRLQNGEFEYRIPLDQSATFHLLYPNFSQLTLFAQSGDDIEVEGDAQNLSAVKVSGSKDNELYTAFRAETTDSSELSTRRIARRYMLEHPTLAVSQYLFLQHFLLKDSLQRSEVTEIYDSLCHACPDDVRLSGLAHAVRSYGLLQAGQKLPAFKLDCTQGINPERKTFKNTDFKGKYLLISFWASWRSGSQSALYRSRRARREMKAKGLTLEPLSYSLDADKRMLHNIEERDSVDYPSYCDCKCFASPLVQQWGIRDLPYFILVGPDMKIIAAGSDWQRDIEPKYRKICL